MAGSWTELLQKLKNGEIDLLSDVSFMEDRAQDMLYASLPMGTEAYYIFGPAGCHGLKPGRGVREVGRGRRRGRLRHHQQLPLQQHLQAR